MSSVIDPPVPGDPARSHRQLGEQLDLFAFEPELPRVLTSDLACAGRRDAAPWWR